MSHNAEPEDMQVIYIKLGCKHLKGEQEEQKEGTPFLTVLFCHSAGEGSEQFLLSTAEESI